MKNYTGLVSRKPPEGLLCWALEDGALQTAGFVYEKIWIEDTCPEAMLTGRRRKRPAVRGRCSECSQEMKLEYMPKEAIYGKYRPVYGFLFGSEVVSDGDEWLCPCCGSQVKVRLASKIGRGSYVTDEAFVVSAALIQEERRAEGGLPHAGGWCAGSSHPTLGSPIVLTQWRIQRVVNRDANERYVVEPVEAYVFEEQEACWLRGWVTAYGGNTGYYMALKSEWSQPKAWKDELGSVGAIFGLTEELIEESCLPNCKLTEFMGIRIGRKLPVAYLRLCQDYPQVENLVVQGCGHILTRLFEELCRKEEYEKNKQGRIPLPELRLEERRPAQMLGLTKEELRWMVEQGWDMYHWRVYVKAKAMGDRMELPGDIELLHRYGGEDVERIIGLAPVGKCLRYLMKQIERMGRMMEETDPDGETEDWDETLDLLSASHLADYWRMAGLAGWDLSDPAVRWPRDLIGAHDRAMAAGKVAIDREKSRLLRQRAEELKGYIYASGELVIFPADSQKALNKEGRELSHCVAGYGKDMAEGKTAIFFIRHVQDVKTPYFTLEYKEGKVAQNRGRKNRARTREVEAFEAEWLGWIARGRPRDKNGRPVGAKPPKVRRNNKKEVHAA